MTVSTGRSVTYIDLGLIDYIKALDVQTRLFNSILNIKKANRYNHTKNPTPNYLLFCEHPHVYTLGRNGNKKNLHLSEKDLLYVQAQFIHTNRGGDITYHGPGQIVVYPILDLENFFTDIHRYMRTLEESVIQTLTDFKIQAKQLKGTTGVWVQKKTPRKICSFGVKTSRWVTMHGLALNVNTDLSYFNHIIPCGIIDKPVTSMQKELENSPQINQVKELLKEKITRLFKMDVMSQSSFQL